MSLQEKIQKKADEYGTLAPIFIEGAKFALKNQWISVDEDLPCNHEELITTEGYYKKETKRVITIDKYEIIDENYMTYSDDGWDWKYGLSNVAWMQIPKLPKE